MLWFHAYLRMVSWNLTEPYHKQMTREEKFLKIVSQRISTAHRELGNI